MYLEAYLAICINLILSTIGSALAKLSLVHLISNNFKSILPFIFGILIGIFGLLVSILILINLEKDNDALLIGGIISGCCNLLTGITIYIIGKKIERPTYAAALVVFLIAILSIYGTIVSILIIVT